MAKITFVAIGLIIILVILFVSYSSCQNTQYHFEESESGWRTGVRESGNVSMHLTGFTVGNGNYSRYSQIGYNDVQVSDRTSAANGSIVCQESMGIESLIAIDPVFYAHKPAGTQDWYVQVDETWPVYIDAYRSLDFKGRQVNDREYLGNNFENSGSSILYADSLRKDTNAELFLQDVHFYAVINNTTSSLLVDKFRPNLTFQINQRLSFDGLATLKYRHSLDRKPVVEGDDMYFGSFTIERMINSTSKYINNTNDLWQMLPCCMDPKMLSESYPLIAPEVRS
jgi:hypothetical protein